MKKKIKLILKDLFGGLKTSDLPTGSDAFYMEKDELIWFKKFLMKKQGVSDLLKDLDTYIYFHECTFDVNTNN